MSTFTHLHLHTQYSLLDGAIRIKALPEVLKERGFDAAAITDHGNLFGAVEFYSYMKKAGLKPIIGMEAYVAKGDRFQRQYDRPGPNASHLVLLCQNREGYDNLVRLSSQGYLDGKYYGVPRIDMELLQRHNKGLIALSACLGGVVNRLLLNGEDQSAKETAQWYGQVFDGRFYLEIQEHGLDKQAVVNPKLMAMAQELGLPLVGTNDCHYLDPEEAEAHYLLQLMGWQKKITDPGVEPFSDKQLHLKSVDQMRDVFAPYPAEVFDNAGAIAEQCELDLSCNTFYLPKYDIPADKTETEFFREETMRGLERRFAQLEPHYGITPEQQAEWRKPYLDRLNYELNVITEMKYQGYFLIVADFINWAKDNGVRVGPGRGSGAGSLVAYAQRITDLDPIRHGLIFERFLNPERVSLPDFDVDFDVAGRERVIDYVRQKYGENRVCQISTFGALKAKAALRGVARVLDFPYSQADKIAKLIPNILNISLEEAIKMEPELARMEQEGEENERKLIAFGKTLEGLNSNLSTHAAGVIIMDQDIQEVMPVCTAAKGEGGVWQSQYSMKWAEEQGAVKFDFLGLLNLTIIEKAMTLVNTERAKQGEPWLDIDAIPLADDATFKLLTKGDTTGVFQLESGGMRRLLADLKPSTFEDIVAILALYRPGPLGSGMTDDFVKRKNREKPADPPHPKLGPVLAETYGVMVYQEQVMEAARVLAGYSLGEADLLRRAMGKKIAAEMEQQKTRFVEGSAANGIDASKAEEVFELINYFSGYGFNKSHSAAYGLVAWQTAWLKANYPVEFMAALLSSDMDNTDKVVSFIADCRSMGVEVLPPDINHSAHDFTIHGRAVRFGLDAVKNVGHGAVDAILEARAEQPTGRFENLADLMRAVDFRRVNKRVFEALIKCGGLDSIHPHRAQLLAALDRMVSLGMEYQDSMVEGQETLFDLLGASDAEMVELKIDLPEAPFMPPKLRLKLEKEALGFYVSGHPLERYASELGDMLQLSTQSIRDGEVRDKDEVRLAGVVAQMSVRLNKKNEKFAILKLEDLRGTVEVMVWSRLFAQVGDMLGEDEPLLIEGRVNERGEDERSIQADRITSLSQFRREQAQSLIIPMTDEVAEPDLPKLNGLLSKQPGECVVRFSVQTANGCTVLVDSGQRILPDEALMEEIEDLLPEVPLHFDYAQQLRSSDAPAPPRRGPRGYGQGAQDAAYG